MTSGRPSKFRGLWPWGRKSAPESPRRQDKSVGDWLNTVVQSTPNDGNDGPAASTERPNDPQRCNDPRAMMRRDQAARGQGRRDTAPESPVREQARRDTARTRQSLGDAHARLDKLSEQLERLGRLDTARQRRASTGSGARESALSIDDAVAEIAARQRALESGSAASAADPPAPTAAGQPAADRPAVETTSSRERAPTVGSIAQAPPTVPAAPVDLSGLEAQLRQITARLDALQPAGDIEAGVATIRTDLAEIGRQLNDALPRRAVESLEIEVKALGERIDHSRQSGVDPNALAGVERGLAEVGEALRTLTPAEHLAGFDEAVRALSQKLDTIVARDDPAALQQIEATIGDLRGLVSHVASNDTLTHVADDVRALAALVDGIANSTTTEHAVAALEQRIDALAAALTASSEAGHAVPHDLEKLLSGLIEKLEWVQLTHTDHAALGHLEDRIATLVQRFDASDARFVHLEGIERGLADLLVHIGEIRGANAGSTAATLSPMSESIEREVAAIRQNERYTRDSLEAVQGTVEHLVDRLAMIESGLRGETVPPATPERPATMAPPSVPAEPAPPAPDAAPPISESAAAETIAADPPTPSAAAARTPIDPTLPPDHPLEPGRTPGRSRPNASAAERIAASEAAIGSTKPPVISDSERPDFIAAARRAAQLAAWEPSAQKTKADDSSGAASEPSKFSQRLRKLIVGASVVLVVIGSMRIATRLFDSGSGLFHQAKSEQTSPPAPLPQTPAPPKQPAAEASPPPLSNPAPASNPTPSSNSAPAAPESTTPAEKPQENVKDNPGRQSMLHEPTAGEVALQNSNPAASLPSWTSLDITGALPGAQLGPDIATGKDQAASHSDEKLPAAIGDPALRKAALAGDPAAAYEVGLRFADGHGVAPNNEAAAYWLEIAARRGLAPAQFRLGSLYEKGLGVAKDLAKARDLYSAAADKGNAKAMHNLAVLYAEGVAGTPDYAKAVSWFRKAADHGVEDSQYNLGILYARGIGVGQNNAESYKWFALAANQGDNDAAKKRDAMASRLDAKSLAAARLVVKKWTPLPVPDDAVNVRAIAPVKPSASNSPAAKKN